MVDPVDLDNSLSKIGISRILPFVRSPFVVSSGGDTKYLTHHDDGMVGHLLLEKKHGY